MPNHITNILEFDCDANRSREIMEFLREDGKEYGSIDFNKLVPMPEALDITAGSETDHSIEIYLTAVNPMTKDYGYRKLEESEFFSLYVTLNSERVFMRYNPRLSDEEIIKYTSDKTVDDYYKLGERAISNIKQYGAITWYDWSIQNWGTKWNAYDCVEVDPAQGYMTFLTAWSSVPEIVKKISEKYPEVPIHYSWADEDIGYNTGRLDFKGGKVTDRDVPEGGTYHAYEIACDVQGYDIEEFDIKPDNTSKALNTKNRDDAR